jgi:ferredoxin
MAFVVTEACIACRYGECAGVCPQSAVHAGPNFVVINPQACANCGLCELVCPVSAIYAAAEVPAGQEQFVELNARLAEVWPAAQEVQSLPEANEHALATEKRHLLIVSF